jgi:large subunit ribosomal protein L3
MKFIIGKKLDMTQLWQGEEMVAVTRIQTEPCVVSQVKTEEKDGYQAVQIVTGSKKDKNMKKPQKGHLKGLGNLGFAREFRSEEEVKRGDRISVESFEPGDKVVVTGFSKGRGFQGVVKRYGFAGASKTHGTKDQVRMPGSVGATGPARVFKGTRMGGRMGGKQVSMTNLEVIAIDAEAGLLLVKGGVPGARNGWLLIRGEGELKTVKISESEKPAAAEVSEAPLNQKPAAETDAKAGEAEKQESKPQAEKVSEEAK